MMKKVALVDLDGMTYAAACVTEEVYYELDGIEFQYKSQATEYASEHNLPVTEIRQDAHAQPVSHAISILQDMVPANVHKSGANDAELFLTPGKDDADHPFRFDFYPKYKANRDGKWRPIHLKALRAYAVKHMGAIMCSHMEADDMIAIRAKEIKAEGNDFVIVTRDKDLQQIPGDFYNHEKHTGTTVTISEARFNLFYQMLVGDTVDNIKGCPNVGPAKAKKALKQCETEEDYLGAVQWLYMQAYVRLEEKARKELEATGHAVPAVIDYTEVQQYADEQLRLNIRLLRMITKREDAHA